MSEITKEKKPETKQISDKQMEYMLRFNFPTPVDMQTTDEIVETLLEAGFFDSEADKDRAKAEARIKIWKGKEIGLPPIASIEQIYVVNRKPAMQALGKLALVKARRPQSRFKYEYSANDTKIVLTIYQNENSEGVEYPYTIEEAKTAGLWTKTNSRWPKIPKQMLRWHVTGIGLDAEYPEILLGIRSLEDEDEWSSYEGGITVEDIPKDEDRKKKKTKKADAIKKAEEPVETPPPPTTPEVLPTPPTPKPTPPPQPIPSPPQKEVTVGEMNAQLQKQIETEEANLKELEEMEFAEDSIPEPPQVPKTEVIPTPPKVEKEPPKPTTSADPIQLFIDNKWFGSSTSNQDKDNSIDLFRRILIEEYPQNWRDVAKAYVAACKTKPSTKTYLEVLWTTIHAYFKANNYPDPYGIDKIFIEKWRQENK